MNQLENPGCLFHTASCYDGMLADGRQSNNLQSFQCSKWKYNWEKLRVKPEAQDSYIYSISSWCMTLRSSESGDCQSPENVRVWRHCLSLETVRVHRTSESGDTVWVWRLSEFGDCQSLETLSESGDTVRVWRHCQSLGTVWVQRTSESRDTVRVWRPFQFGDAVSLKTLSVWRLSFWDTVGLKTVSESWETVCETVFNVWFGSNLSVYKLNLPLVYMVVVWS